MKQLLVFAHRGEAQTFLKELPVKAHARLQNLYLGERTSILITGEGEQSVISNLSMTLGICEEITSIVNLGICGALNPEIEIGSIISPRTIYAESEFKSYPNNDSSHKIDLITTKRRVLSLNESKKLSHIATLVDREAWAVAFCAKKFNINFSVTKLVSDHIREAVFCENIKERALEYSQSLYEYFCDQSRIEEQEESSLSIFENKSLYFTVSSKRNTNNLLKALLSKTQLDEQSILEKINIKSISDSDSSPKERVNLINERLTQELYPFKTKISSLLQDITKDLRKYDSEFKFDKDLEKKSFRFIANIDSKEKRDIVVKLLKDFPYEEFEKIMNGEFDV